MEGLHSKYEQQLQHIWANPDYKNDAFLSTYINRGFALPEIEKNELLFIGLNPAGKEKKDILIHMI